ncbi:choline dehydrogenase [Photobacterium sp. SDRW27]|uniref:GMC family oxidoreductase n=1 Tax=Photobacterium obscurum TaxID=2829490 RepID=UPI0022433227|nr:choline dehydrogenase [Photobacterium obscurum]MCW8327682.1 choline dehydrogenase [Photobacterium obscurum]
MYDFIIVGAGSAGCVLANRLSSNPNIKVCLVEAGPKDSSLMVHVPLGIIGMMHSKKMNWRYYTEQEPNLNGRRLFWPRGKTLGGSSASNAMCYIRGHACDYDKWAALGNEGWGYQDVQPYFKKSECQERGGNAYHGDSGPLSVSDLRIKNPLSEAFIKAAKQAGHKLTQDFNADEQEGVGYYQVTQKNGQRCSTAVGYLRPAEQRENLTVITDALTTKVTFDGTKATGIEYLKGGSTHTLQCSGEVLLSGGAINSPQLLLLSGVGNKDQLNQHGIPVVCDLPGVGENMQDHLDVLAVTRERTFYSVGFSPVALLRSMKGIVDYLLFRKGNFTSNIAEAGGFVKSSPELAVPDIQFHFSPCFLDNHGLNLWQTVRHGYSLHACNLRPKSRGRLTLRDSNPATPPRINANYLGNEEDIEVMVKGIKLSREILKQPAFDCYRGAEVYPGKDVQSDEALKAFIRRKAESIYHPVGTCKMGIDDMAVVDPQLKVRGITGVRVVDASIMPTLIGGNTNAPTIMIAEKASDMILDEQLKKSEKSQELEVEVL